MPELPEVETVRAGLAPVMEGRRFIRVQMNRPDLRFPLPERFRERLEGQSVISLKRRAKFLMAEISTGELLLMHLGMSGRFTIAAGAQSMANSPTIPKHDHVVFTMSGEDKPTITYNDVRRFGFMELLAARTCPNMHMLIRSQYNRNLKDEEIKLYDFLAQQPLRYTYKISIIHPKTKKSRIYKHIWRP